MTAKGMAMTGSRTRTPWLQVPLPRPAPRPVRGGRGGGVASAPPARGGAAGGAGPPRAPGAPPLACPVTAFGGAGDVLVPQEDLEAWAAHTTGPFRLRLLPGDHFFLNGARDELLRGVGEELSPT